MTRRLDPHEPVIFDPSRRRFIQGVAGTTGALALGACGSDETSAARAALPADPKDSGIDHIVVVMMENRSFDHMLGWVPGADGLQEGLVYLDRNGEPQETHNLGAAGNFQGCGDGDPSHNFNGGRTHYNNGRMDGFLQTDPTHPGDTFPIGYYKEEHLPFFSGAVRNFTVCDKFFSSFFGNTFPNRIYLHAGETDRLVNTLPIVEQTSELPTIWDRCRDGDVSHRYYFQDLPVTGLWGVKYLNFSRPVAQFYLDAALGNLPAVSYIDPFFGASLTYPVGLSMDDHPHADIRDGQAFQNSIYEALRNSPQWERTLLIFTYDEWGGFFDHVSPPFAPITEREREVGNDGQLGIRIPTFILGPRARRNHVSHFQFDFNSIINLITWRFGLEPLGIRAATSENLALALDFDNPPDTSAPSFNVPLVGSIGSVCHEVITEGIPMVGEPLDRLLAALRETLDSLSPTSATALAHKRELQQVLQVARASGWPI